MPFGFGFELRVSTHGLTTLALSLWIMAWGENMFIRNQFISRVLWSLLIPAVWLRHHLLCGVVSVWLQSEESWWHYQWPVASRFTGPKPLDYHVWVAMLEAYHKHHPQPKTIIQLKEMLQMIRDSLPQGPIDKVAEEFPKWLKACVKLNIYSDYRILRVCCIIWVTLFHSTFAQTFLNSPKSLGVNTATLIYLRTVYDN